MGYGSVIRSAVFIVWSVAALGGVCAQEMPITSAAAYAEKIYLQTDADVYTTDGSIWFNAVVVSSQNLRPTTLSGVLHVELIASDERVVDRKRIKLAGGSGAGSFQLNDSYTQGVYQIRAYTEWNKNFGVDFIAERYVHLFPTSAEIDRTPITALQLHESTPSSYVLYAQLMPTMIDSAHKKDLAAFLTVDQHRDTLHVKEARGGSYVLKYPLPTGAVLATLTIETQHGKRFTRVCRQTKVDNCLERIPFIKIRFFELDNPVFFS